MNLEDPKHSDPRPTVTVLYHNDSDGFGAAYACWIVFGDAATYIPVQYGQPVPEIPEGTEQLYIVDFSYDRQTCLALRERFEKVIILDHHRSAMKELELLPFTHFDMNRSGAVMAWDYFWPGVEAPKLLQYVQDRDLWKFELPDSEAINLFIATLPFDFGVWNFYADDEVFSCEAPHAGKAIKAFRDRQIEGALRDTRMAILAGYEVPMVNCSANISEVGNELCRKYPDAPFSVSYCDRGDGKRSFSLRSIGDFDVSAVAKLFGGGGHRNAAGFSMPSGWPEVHGKEFCEAFGEAAKRSEA